MFPLSSKQIKSPSVVSELARAVTVDDPGTKPYLGVAGRGSRALQVLTTAVGCGGQKISKAPQRSVKPAAPKIR